MSETTGELVYKDHRIHVCRLVTGGYAAAVVHPGAANGPCVETVPGVYQSREEAGTTAKAHIDTLEMQQQGVKQVPRVSAT